MREPQACGSHSFSCSLCLLKFCRWGTWVPVSRNLSEGLESGQCRRWREAAERADCTSSRVLRLDSRAEVLRDSDDGGVEFPVRGHVNGAATVVKILKSHAKHRDWPGLRQFTAVTGVERKAMFLQLGLRRLAGTAKFAVHDGFHNHPGSVLIGGHGNFEVHIAIGGVDAGFVEKCGGHMEHLKLPPGSWRVGSDESVLGPT